MSWRNVQRIGDPTGCGDTQGEGSGNVFVNGIPLARESDKSAGHCFPPVPITSWSPNVFVNNLGAARKGDVHPTHCCGSSCHQCAAFPAGSPDVFVN